MRRKFCRESATPQPPPGPVDPHGADPDYRDGVVSPHCAPRPAATSESDSAVSRLDPRLTLARWGFLTTRLATLAERSGCHTSSDTPDPRHAGWGWVGAWGDGNDGGSDTMAGPAESVLPDISGSWTFNAGSPDGGGCQATDIGLIISQSGDTFRGTHEGGRLRCPTHLQIVYLDEPCGSGAILNGRISAGGEVQFDMGSTDRAQRGNSAGMPSTSYSGAAVPESEASTRQQRRIQR